MTRTTWLLAAALVSPTLLAQTPPPALEVGRTLELELAADAPRLADASLVRPENPAPTGVSLALRVTAPGPYTVEVRSLHFYASVLVKGGDGELGVAHTPGNLSSRTRLTLPDVPAGEYVVSVTGWDEVLEHGAGGVDVSAVAGRGPFTISVRPGAEEASAQEVWLATIDDLPGRVERLLAEDGPSFKAAQYLISRAMLLTQLGRAAEAVTDGNRAVEVLVQAIDPDDMFVSRAHYVVALAHEDLQDFPSALEASGRALAIAERAFSPNDPRIAQVLLAHFGHALMCQDHEKVAEYGARVVEMQEASNPQIATVSLHNLSNALSMLGRHREAREASARALESAETVYGPRDPKTANFLIAHATNHFNLDLWTEAEPLFERAHALLVDQLGPDHEQVAFVAGNLGAIHVSRFDYDRARPYFAEASRVYTGLYGPKHRLSLHYRSAHAMCLPTEEAIPALERFLAECEPELGPAHRQVVAVKPPLMRHLILLDRFDRARELGEQLVAAGADAELHYTAVLRAMDGDAEGALELARREFDREEAELDRTFEFLSESERVRFQQRLLSSLEAVLTYHRLASPDEDEEREIHDVVRRWKGRVFRSAHRERVVDPDAPDARLLARLRAAQEDLSNAHYARAANPSEDDDAALAKLLERRNELELELVRRRRERQDPAREATPSVPLHESLARLATDAVAIDFFRVNTRTWFEDGAPSFSLDMRTTYLAWVSRAGSPDVERIELGDANAIDAALTTLFDLLIHGRAPHAGRGIAAIPRDSSRDDARRRARAAERAAHGQLRSLLWDPLRDAVGDASIVVVSADAALGTFPFGILEEEDGTTLLERHAFLDHDLGSLAATLASATPASSDELLVVGDVDYDARGADASTEIEPITLATAPTTALTRDISLDGWSRLPATRAEARRIADVHAAAFGDDAPRTALLGADAAEARVKDEIAGRRFVHLATHGFFQPEEFEAAGVPREERGYLEVEARLAARSITGRLPGLLSGLAFAGANLPPDPDARRDNGLLSAEEASSLDLRACDLLVLSACQTGLGRAESGEGMIGLRRSFRLAGARTVVSSLWSVDDEATARLMSDFYRNLWERGMTKLEALRRAQLDMLARNRERLGHADPATWGAFILDGAPD